jgi:hypothetical protein
VTTPSPPAPTAPPLGPIGHDDRKWLHDKYERLDAEEGQLASARTAYYAAIGTVLLTGMIVAIADLINDPEILVVILTFLAGLGVLISVVWTVLLHRTNDAQKLWRESARHLEQGAPPLEGEFRSPISLRSGETISVDLFRPFQTHDARFSRSNKISWMDRIDPTALTEILPKTFLGIWATIGVLVWVWFLFFR